MSSARRKQTSQYRIGPSARGAFIVLVSKPLCFKSSRLYACLEVYDVSGVSGFQLGKPFHFQT